MKAPINKSQSQTSKQQTASALAAQGRFMPAWLRPAEAAAYLGISKTTLYRKIKDDPTFPHLHRLSDSCSVMNREALDAWVIAQPITAI